MKVILKDSYMNLGEAGDIVEVRPGYARNFLIPQKIALTATAANLKFFQDKAKELGVKKEKEREVSRGLLAKLEKLSITVKKKVSDDGKLFGSVTTKDLEAEFAALGAIVDRRMIVLGKQIKTAGEHNILVKLVGGLRANVPLHIVSDAPPKAVYVEEEYTPMKMEDEPKKKSKKGEEAKKDEEA